MPAGASGDVSVREADTELVERERVWREGTTMVLYVSVVLLATLAALPSGHDGVDGRLHGPVGLELMAIVWGTTIGLAVAHLFAFRVATRGVGAGRVRPQEQAEELAQLGGAAFVAAVVSIPVLVFSGITEQRAVPFVLAVIIGGIGYLVERAHGRTRLSSALFGGITLVIALAVATLKIVLSGH
jgi:hypothetical protein